MRMIVMGLVLALLPGCAGLIIGAGAAGAAGGYVYAKGELRQEYDAPMDPTWAATVKALHTLEIEIVETRLDQSGTTIAGREGDGTPVQVTLEPRGSERTLAGIRVGTLGDRDRSQQVAEAIQKQL